MLMHDACPLQGSMTADDAFDAKGARLSLRKTHVKVMSRSSSKGMIYAMRMRNPT